MNRKFVWMLMSGMMVLPLGACSDDGDDISGPLADCVEEIDEDDWFFDDGDLETLELEDETSGSIRATDVEFDGYYYDVYVFAHDAGNDLRLTVDPTGDFDVVFQINTLDGESDFVDDEGPGLEEVVVFDQLAEECYVVYVSSAELEDTGSYTIEVEDL